MLRRLTTALAALVLLYHADLLVAQAWSGALADPTLVVRWLLSAGLVASLVRLRGLDASPQGLRQVVVLGLLAAMLHVPLPGTHPADPDTSGLPESAVTLLQAASEALALGLGCWLLATALRRPARHGAAACTGFVAAPSPALDLRGFRFPVAPRPPPIR